MPAAAGLCTLPGTAMTGTPSSPAMVAVISDPPRSRDSTTTTHLGERGDDPVAQREAPRLGAGARRRLGDEHAGVGDRAPQLAVLAG